MANGDTADLAFQEQIRARAARFAKVVGSKTDAEVLEIVRGAGMHGNATLDEIAAARSGGPLGYALAAGLSEGLRTPIFEVIDLFEPAEIRDVLSGLHATVAGLLRRLPPAG